MLTTSQTRAVPTSKGWVAEYHMSGEKEPYRLCDAFNKPLTYHSAKDAKIAAQEALIAAMERADAEYIDPHPDQYWLAVNPKTRAGFVLQANKKLFRDGARA